MNPKIIRLIIVMVSLGLIAYGAWGLYKPLGYLVPGLLIWVDLFREWTK